ncbi:MAG: hypothetical protein ACIALR_02095 [Blastopirellula sp. JB062]
MSKFLEVKGGCNCLSLCQMTQIEKRHNRFEIEGDKPLRFFIYN